MRRTSIGFRVLSQNILLLMKGIGNEKITSHNYSWNGKKRKDNHCLIQYTISGEGEIEIEGELYSLKVGDAFIVDIPSDHCYRLPKSSKHWEFIYVEFSKEAHHLLRDIYQANGQVIHMGNQENEFIQLFWETYEMAINDHFINPYQNSEQAYRLIMTLASYFYEKNKVKVLSPKIEKCKTFIDCYYMRQIGLEDISKLTKNSKFHLSREFEKEVGLPPIKYLNKVRIEQAMILLTSQDIKVEEVAKKVGFMNANYFSKVFKKYTHLSPSQFCKNSRNYELSRILFDK